MAVIYLKHPKFGTKVATLDQEADYDKEHGWEEYDPLDDVDSADDNVKILNTLQLKRRGKLRQENTA